MSKHFNLFLLVFIIVFSVLFVASFSSFVSANYYVADIYFIVPDAVYMTGERIEFKGYLFQANYSDNRTIISNSTALASATVNLTIRSTNGTYLNNYTLTTASNGAFYSKSNYYTNATEINASSTAGNYYLRAEYIDPNNETWFSEIEITAVNKTLDVFDISPDKATYNPSETMIVNIEAIRLIGDRILFVSNVLLNGTLRNSTKSILQTFNCTTGTNGKCMVSLIAPSTNGNYIFELNNFKAFSSFSVVPFSFSIYIRDELGKSMKNVFAPNEQGMIEVKINNASSSESYTFSGYIADSNGNVMPAASGGVISSNVLNATNSFTNTAMFTITTSYNFGAYTAYITVTKTGDGSITSLSAFQVQEWLLSVEKKEVSSGFEYEYSTFPNKTLRFEALPTYRSNGSVISGINSTSFNITLKDNLNNILASTNANWNASCGKSGCYEFSINSPINTEQYVLSTTLAHSGDTQTDNRVINIISGVMSAESTDKDGSIKELFGTNEYAYLSLSAYNSTSSAFNLTNAEIFIVSYMNGTEFSYTNVSTFDLVNASNLINEWAWNSSLQRIKLDVPKSGGFYTVFIFGNSRTLGGIAKFIVNPYDVCSAAKTSAGTIDNQNSWYAWQFKTTDTVYFEIKITQANNPSGRATALNMSTNSTNSSQGGIGAACNVNTQTKQAVTNATLTIAEVSNLESGALQNVNLTGSTCYSTDNSGSYTCTVKPLTKWEGGQNIVKLNIQGQDGTTSVAYSRFEARAFYLYGWSTTWQNNPSSNITLQVQMYEAGRNWWYSQSSLTGTVKVKKVEYQGRDGEWIWPPVDSGYNVSSLNSTSITSNSWSNQISLPASYTSGGAWKTGYYRVILQATTSSGDTDYGYAWFSVKLWDVYGSPIECTSSGCNYKNYFNSKENITLYITISKAGDNWWYSDYYGGRDIYGNVTVGIKKIQNCRTWPCKELNSSQFAANTINVNSSSPWYYYSANIANQSRYIIQINKTTGTWSTGYYSVVLDVNGTDTGYAWFNTIAFYVETQPTDANGSNYKYSIRGRQPMYFNVTTTKSYKWWSYSGARYNQSDYINATVDDVVLRTWDQVTYQSKEYNYPEDINITPLTINGNGLINITFLNRTTNTTATWPTGYYWGELTLKNSENETSTGWLWFNVQPFRVNIYATTYEIDSDQCVNASLSIYDPDWYSSTPLYGNYSITSVYENIWSGYGGSSQTPYNNYTNSSFNATTYALFCPNNNNWGSGSWGGYHYLNIVVTNNESETQTGWLSFRTIPFRVTWNNYGSVGSVRTNQNINLTVNLTRPSTGAATIGNLTKIYQWRYDNYQSTREEYAFSVVSGGVNCSSSVSGQCTVNGTANITIYFPSNGWKVGWNYLQAEWANTNDGTLVQDWSGIYFDGLEAYNGWFDNYWYTDSTWIWKYEFAVNENITIKLNVRNSSYNSVNVTIRNVEYAFSGTNCWSDWCRSYTSGNFTPTSTTNGIAYLNISVPSSNWTKGYYAIRATVNGSAGTATITGGQVRVKDFVAPTLNVSIPVNNATYNTSLIFSATTSENAQCYIYIVNYDNFYNWYCWNWNSTNAGACNSTLYNYNGSSYYYESVYQYWHYIYNGSAYSYPSSYLSTGGISHTYAFNISAWPSQHYGMQIWCNDDDWNYVSALKAFKVNNTIS